MGRTIKCTYKLEMSCVDFKAKCIRWQTFGLMAKDIKPTETDVKRYRDAVNQSIINGCNQHLNALQSLYGNARLTDQRTNELVVNYKAPMFEII